MWAYFNAFMKGYVSKVEIIILPVEKSDLAVLSKIHHSSFNHGWSDGDIEKMVSNQNYDSFVAHPPKTKKSKPLGFVLARRIADEAEIITIAISPDARRKGIASQLMRSVIRKLQYDRTSKLFLEVDEANSAAVAMYKALGFVQVGKREGYYSSKKQDAAKKSTALVMQLELS